MLDRGCLDDPRWSQGQERPGARFWRCGRRIGCGIVGLNAGDVIAEAALAIEKGADATDIGATIHPHPTLSETVGMVAEMFEGTITDLIPPRRETQ